MQNILNYVDHQISPTAQIAFVGDIMQHDIQHKFEESLGFSYQCVFDVVKSYCCGFDLMIGNLETTISSREVTGFPKFAAHPNFLAALKDAGFQTMITANNHASDYGDAGIVHTYATIMRTGLDSIGTMNQNKKCYEINGVKFCIHAATDITNSEDRSKLMSFVDLSTIPYLEPDHIHFMYVHAGKEYSAQTTERQKEIAAYYKFCGFRGVVFSHSHVIQEFVQEDNFFVHYGLGNFISAQENLDRQLGQMLIIEFNERNLFSIGLQNTEAIIEKSGATYLKMGENMTNPNTNDIKNNVQQSITKSISEMFSEESFVDTEFVLLNDIEISAISTTAKEYTKVDPTNFDKDSKPVKLKAAKYLLVNNDDKYVVYKLSDSKVYISKISDLRKSHFKTSADIFDS